MNLSARPVHPLFVAEVSGVDAGRPLDARTLAALCQAIDRYAVLVLRGQDFDEIVHLPPGFEPTRVNVEVHAGRDASRSFRQAFVWKTQGVSVETEALHALADAFGHAAQRLRSVA